MVMVHERLMSSMFVLSYNILVSLINCFMLFEFYFFLRNMILFGNLVMVIELYIAR